MRTRLLLLAVVAVAVLAVPAKLPTRGRNFYVGRRTGQYGMGPRPKASEEATKAVTAGNFDQTLDHFDSSNSQTWRQRYWYNNENYQKGGPAFLYIGGEGPESASSVAFNNGLLWTDIAKSKNAFIFCLEHRYYGASHPTSDMSTDNLAKYLNSRQAIEDLAAFITAMNAQFFPDGAPQWVTFGGSYPGALSSWVRLKHPELVVGSSASSAPINAQVDFGGYLEVVKYAITDVDADCASSIQQGFQQVATLLQSASGRQSLRNTFNLCDPLTAASGDDVLEFYSQILGAYMVVVQYHNIEYSISTDICKYHTQSAVPVLTRMKNFNDHMNEKWGSSCTYTSYQGYIQFYKDTTYGQAAQDRAWIFQTCQEFGYFQSTDTTQDFWSSGLPVDYYTNTCRDIFGSQYTPSAIQANIDSTNAYYGALNPSSSKVVFPNGSYDPWHALSLLNTTNSDLVLDYITATAHCMDMYSQSSRDSDSLKAGKQKVIDSISAFLSS